MLKFSTKDLLISSTFVAIGLGTYIIGFHYPWPMKGELSMRGAFLTAGGGLIAIGLTYPFAKTWSWLRYIAILIAVVVGGMIDFIAWH